MTGCGNDLSGRSDGGSQHLPDPFSSERFSFAKSIAAILNSPFRSVFLHFLHSAAWADYFATQRVKTLVIDVSLSIDNEIPFIATSTRTYVSFVPVCLTGLLHLHSQFGKSATASILQAFERAEVVYAFGGAIFRVVQTTFPRPPTNSLGLLLVRAIDRNRNCFPSMHAQLVAIVHSTIMDTVGALAADPPKYSGFVEGAFDQTVAILESCLLTKQHSVQDIAAGLASLSIHDATFSESRAKALIEAMFTRRPYGLKPSIIDEIHAVMATSYSSVFNSLESCPPSQRVQTVQNLLTRGQPTTAVGFGGA